MAKAPPGRHSRELPQFAGIGPVASLFMRQDAHEIAWPRCFLILKDKLAAFGTENAITYGMKPLRERGIYQTPNGETLVASRERKTAADGKRIVSRLGNRLSCYLFGRYDWAYHGTPAYEVATTGRLVALKQPSYFQPSQLIDTGATAGAH